MLYNFFYYPLRYDDDDDDDEFMNRGRASQRGGSFGVCERIE
jgi:hypothetical protein